MRVAKFLLIGVLWLVSASGWAQVPELLLDASLQRMNLAPLMAVESLPDNEPLDPDALWSRPVQAPVADAPQRFKLAPGERVIGRIHLRRQTAGEHYVVQVPSSRVDLVQLWFRPEGQGWQAAKAGDLVPLSQWPFASQHPSFDISMHGNEADIIVALSNDAWLKVPVILKSDRVFREDRLLQANLSGLVMGMGLMVTLVCVISAINLRRYASWVLVLYAGWAAATVASVNGYAALWFFPEAPAFNDRIKNFMPLVLAGLMLWAVTMSVTHLGRRSWIRGAGPVVVGLALLLGAAQWLWLPASWRIWVLGLWTGACVLGALALCALSALSEGRYLGQTTAGVLSYATAIVLGAVFAAGAHGPDGVAALAGLLLFASCLLMRNTVYSKERYGRDVLARAAIQAHRDPLTALLSFNGFKQVWDENLLRGKADAQTTRLLYLALPALDACHEEHGFVLTEQALVRFSAGLHKVLGDNWTIARLHKNRFACISHGLGADAAGEATRLLASCGRMREPLPIVSVFDLRIVAVQRQLHGTALTDVIGELEAAAQGMPEGRRIATI